MANYNLRRKPVAVSPDAARKVFGLDENWRPIKYVPNQYEDRGDVVFDHATGLTWQKGGSEDMITYEQAGKYVTHLNHYRFAGHADWRLPTVAELASLLEQEEQSSGLYISTVFGETEYDWLWSSDLDVGGEQFDISFFSGCVRCNSGTRIHPLYRHVRVCCACDEKENKNDIR